MSYFEPEAGTLSIGPFTFNFRSGELSGGGLRQTLMPKDCAVLACLVSMPGSLIRKEELLDTVWKGTIVSESVLKACIKRLRKVLGDDFSAPVFIETVRGRGYRFIAPVHPVVKTGSESNSGRKSFIQPELFVGRRLELSQMKKSWCSVKTNGKRRIAMISGEAGIGKSTLVDYFLGDVCNDGDTLIAKGQSVQTQGPGESYGPFFMIFHSLAESLGRERFTQLLFNHAPMWLIQIPGLILPDESQHLQDQLMGISGRRMLRELSHLMEAVGRITPLVLVLEDLHWSDEATLDAWAFLGQETLPVPFFLISTHRPAEIHDLSTKGLMVKLASQANCDTIELPFFDVQEIRQYIDLKFHDRPFPADLAEWLYRYTEGNPLFFKTLLSHASSQGWFQPGSSANWSQGVQDEFDKTVPDNLRGLIEIQFQSLGSTVLSCLQMGAVIGMVFPTRFLCDDSGPEEMRIEAYLEKLARIRHLICFAGPITFPDGSQSPCYTFTHAWYRRVAYDRIPMLQRQELHRSVGERMEKLYDGQTQQVAAKLSTHFELGRVFAKALVYRYQAGLAALGQHAYAEGKMHIRRGITMLDHIKEEPERNQWGIKLHIPLGNALIASEGYGSKDAITVFDRAHQLCRLMPPSPGLMPVLHGMSIYYLARGNFPEAARFASQLHQAADLQKDTAHHIWGHALNCMIQWYQGRYRQSLETADKGIAAYKPEKHRILTRQYGFDGGIICLIYRAHILSIMGYHDQAEKEMLSALSVTRSYAGPFMLAWALSFTGWIYNHKGNCTKAGHYFGQCLTLSQKQGIDHWIAEANALQGSVRVKTGEVEKGLKQIQEAAVAHRNTGIKLVRAKFNFLVAEALALDGDPGQALPLMDEAVTLINELDERWWEAEMYRLRGDLLIMHADRGEVGFNQSATLAEGCYRHALKVSRGQESKSLELRATVSMARLWDRQDKQAAARDMLADVIAWFPKELETGDLTEARNLLKQLG